MQILTDRDVSDLLPPAAAVEAMERAFRLLARGSLVAPPRWSLASEGGRLVLTAGAALGARRDRLPRVPQRARGQRAARGRVRRQHR